MSGLEVAGQLEVKEVFNVEATTHQVTLFDPKNWLRLVLRVLLSVFFYKLSVVFMFKSQLLKRK